MNRIEFELECFRPCRSYVPTRMRMLSGTRQKTQLTSTYFLETDEKDGRGSDASDKMTGLQTIKQVHVRTGDGWRRRDGMIRWKLSNNWLSSRTSWGQMKRMGWDDQMRDDQTIDQVHIHPGDRRRGWDRMITWEVFKQFTKFTYILETDEEDRMGWSDERASNNWPSLRTPWR